MPIEELRERIDWMEGTAVFKAVTDESTTDGLATFMAKETSQLSNVLKKLDGADEVIIEEYLATPVSYSLSFTLSHDGSIMYSGAAERNIDVSGNQNSYWLEAEPHLPPTAMNLGVMIATHCIEMGYHGFLHMDIGVLENDEIRLFDLNFRATNVTTALNYKDSILERTKTSTMLLTSWNGKGDFQQLVKTAHNLLDQNTFLPLWSYNPLADGIKDLPPRIGGLILGNSRSEVIERKEHIAAMCF